MPRRRRRTVPAPQRLGASGPIDRFRERGRSLVATQPDDSRNHDDHDEANDDEHRPPEYESASLASLDTSRGAGANEDCLAVPLVTPWRTLAGTCSRSPRWVTLLCAQDVTKTSSAAYFEAMRRGKLGQKAILPLEKRYLVPVTWRRGEFIRVPSTGQTRARVELATRRRAESLVLALFHDHLYDRAREHHLDDPGTAFPTSQPGPGPRPGQPGFRLRRRRP